MGISIILGTRPEIIKMSPIIRECHKRNLDYYLLHTGQHYSYNLDKVFFEDLELPLPRYNTDVGSGTHAEETGNMLIEIEKILKKDKANIVLVEGDTNTVFAGALAATKLHIEVGHVEAGLRSYDKSMPEEINRILTDHISDYLFAPTETAKNNMIKEGILKEKISITGNTIVDAVNQNLDIAKRKVDILNELELTSKEYLLITSHRQENVDNKEKFKRIFESLKLIHEEHKLPIIYPIHPRAMKRIKEFNIDIPRGVRLIEPIGFLKFLMLESNARLILTDSGGVQEEACILKVPCITLRENTERPETIEVGSNILVGTDPDKILGGVNEMIDQNNTWENPFGDGKSGKKIIDILEE